MATNSLHSIPQHNNHHHHHHHNPPPPSATNFFLKPTTTTNIRSRRPSFSSVTTPGAAAAASSSSPTSSAATTSTSLGGTTFDTLLQHLTAKNYRQADEETRRLLIALAGDAAVKRGYVFFSEVQFIAEADLKAIDALWRQHSDGRFGYSVQKKIWEKTNNDFTKFFIKVGWMKRLDTEMEQYNYRSFPTEFQWELNDDTPEGHLPLTNALRGTRLLTCIFTHPAFKETEEEGDKEQVEEAEAAFESGSKPKPLINKIFKTDYSF